jgi:hypothetical protein
MSTRSDPHWQCTHARCSLTLTVIAQDGASLKRLRVTPGPDTSVDTLAKMNAIQ